MANQTQPQPQPQPRIGLLSRTLSPSPTIRWILPARIRCQSKNDVVFIGPTYIQLREFLDNGQLADASAKLELCTQILSATVISAKLEIIPTLDAILEQERDQERYTIKGKPLEPCQPPEILLLSTMENELLYVYAKETEPNTVKFVFARRYLLGGLALPEKYGIHMAIDPESRAVAIAPNKGHCAIFSLKPVDEIKDEIDNWQPQDPVTFKPTLEQQFVQVDGFILKMEFLRSTKDDPNKIILVLLVANGDETRVLLYRWDTRHPLYRMKLMKCSGQTLEPEDSFPLLLIPSAQFTAFVLVTETAVVYYDDVMSEKLQRFEFTLPQDDIVRRQDASRQPLMVQWAKPRRHSGYISQNDDIVIVREDGLLLSYMVGYGSPQRIDAMFSPGVLGINVDTAFCILAGPPNKGGDIIIAGGDMANGGVFHLQARDHPKMTQTLANMAPVQDMMLIEPSSKANSTTFEHMQQTSRLFLASGKTENDGTIVELLHGLEARTGWTIDDPDSGTIERLWTLDLASLQEVWFFWSSPLYTSLMRFDLQSQEFSSGDTEDMFGLDFNSSTHAFGVVSDKAIVQVTTKNTNVYPLENDVLPTSLSFDGECLCACFDEHLQIVGCATRNPDEFEVSVQHVRILADGQITLERQEDHLLIHDEPVSICFGQVSNNTFLIIGTESGHIYGFQVREDNGLRPAFKCTVQELIPHVSQTSVSSVCILNYGGWSTGLLLCGLRNGFLICGHLNFKELDDKASIDLTYKAHYQLGSTTVSISAELTSPTTEYRAALVLCGSDLRRMNLIQNGSLLDHDMATVWVTKRKDLPDLQPAINAVHRIQKLDSDVDGILDGLLVCATQENISFSSLTTQRQSIMRRVSIKAHPRRIVFSRYLNKIVVGVDINETSDTNWSEEVMITAKPVRPALYLQDLDLLEPKTSTDPYVPFGDVGEHIRCLINWTPTDGSQHYEMIVVALEREDVKTSRMSGRVVCISAKNFKQQTVEIKPRMIANFPGKPVSALCPSGKSSLAVAVGNEIVLYNLDVGSRKWATVGRYPLPSAATSLSAQGSLIHVATTYHSVIVLREDKSAKDPKNTLVFHSSDLGARNTTNILAFNNTSSLVTAISDNGTDIIAFGGSTVNSDIKAIFQASIPLIIDRIRKDRTTKHVGYERQQFHACTVDGTIYHFKTLAEEEWKLLYFLESLCTIKDRPHSQEPAQYVDRTTGKTLTAIRSSSLYIQGDLLANMIDSGPYNLHNLLNTRIKKEDSNKKGASARDKLATLKELARPVVKPSEDVVASVCAWLRLLLRYPSV